MRCLCVMVTTMGMVMFSLPSIFLEKGDVQATSILGFVLLSITLLADGGVSFSQKIMMKHQMEKPGVFDTMLYMSSWQSLFSLLVVFLSWGDKGGFYFCLDNPNVLRLLLWPSLIESIGQIFVYRLIIHNGPLFTSLVTTMRKFITIVLSVVVFGHSVSMTQWFSILMVFIGVSVDAMYSIKT